MQPDRSAEAASEESTTGPTFSSPDAEAIYRLRWTRLGLSQAAFAMRFGIPYATVQNIEQSRGQPKPLARLVLAAIELDPGLMARAAKAVNAPGSGSHSEGAA